MSLQVQPALLKRTLAEQGLLIGLPRSTVIATHAEVPFIELPLRIESLPSDSELKLLLFRSQAEIVWRIEVDDLHLKHLESTAWHTFIDMIASTRAGERFVLSFDRTVEYSDAVIDSIEKLRDASTVSVCLDTEHTSWKSNHVQSILKSLRLAHVFVDAPMLPAIVKDATYDAGKIACLRCVGRNGGSWFEPNPEQRFNYIYSNTELTQLAARISDLRGRYDQVYVTFNNRPAVAAWNNANQLASMLMR
jgi:uncharacterized protein YecE (DUF72 family)